MLVTFYPDTNNYYIEHYNENVMGPFVSYDIAKETMQEIQKVLDEYKITRES